MERVYVKDERGRFIPEHVLNDSRARNVYLSGYGDTYVETPEPRNDEEKLRWKRLYDLGMAVFAQLTDNPNHFRTDDKIHYFPPELRKPEPFREPKRKNKKSKTL